MSNERFVLLGRVFSWVSALVGMLSILLLAILVGDRLAEWIVLSLSLLSFSGAYFGGGLAVASSAVEKELKRVGGSK
jgi:hypothetical protein